MDYRQAVMTALQGDGSGFAWLYEATQHDMYYIALKYMKNEDDAMDVLQDSYMKAWQSLASLKEPENFRAWFGRIVANTAKNALEKSVRHYFRRWIQKMGMAMLLNLILRMTEKNISRNAAIQKRKPSFLCVS